jgi:hypothetical protein
MEKVEMLKALIDNELGWLASDPTFENMQDVVEFFANGGFNAMPDDKIEALYKQLTA